MAEHDIDPTFERRLEEHLRAYSEQVVEPFDAVEIAHLAASGAGRGRRPADAGRQWLPAPVMGVLLTAALLVGLTVTAFAAGWLPLPPPDDGPSPSPTTAAHSPAPLTPEPTAEPTIAPTPAETPTSTPTTPAPTPAASPTVEPSPSPPPATAVIGPWRELTNFPSGGDGFVVVRSVIAGGPGFVAVGLVSDGAGNIAGGRAWTSTDGQSWTVVDSDAFANAKLELVVEHLGVLYAVGPIPTDDEDHPDLGAYNVWRSADGQSWELLPQPAAFAEPAIVGGLTSAGETLVAWGSRNVAEGGQTVVRPGIWTWTPTASGDWTLADNLPDTYDIQRMAYSSQTLVAIGNNRSEQAPWRTIWYSTDEGRTWQAGDARFIDQPNVTLEDVAALTDPAPIDHPGGVFIAVGWQGQREETFPFHLATTYERDWFSGGPLTGYLPYMWERVVAIPGGFLVIGTEYRFEINPNCAPGPCEELIPVAARLWTANAVETHWADGFGGLVFDEAESPAAALWFYGNVAVGNNGIVMTASDADFNRSIWFAPLTLP